MSSPSSPAVAWFEGAWRAVGRVVDQARGLLADHHFQILVRGLLAPLLAVLSYEHVITPGLSGAINGAVVGVLALGADPNAILDVLKLIRSWLPGTKPQPQPQPAPVVVVSPRPPAPPASK